jgi:hypothetical protein
MSQTFYKKGFLALAVARHWVFLRLFRLTSRSA